MKKTRYILFLCYLLFSSCSQINLFEDSGPETEAFYEVNSFNKIELEGIFNVNLIQNDIYSITIKGGENILDKFSFTDQDNTLTLKHNYSNWLHNLDIPELEIHCSTLNQIQFNSSSNLQSVGTLTGDKLKVLVTEEADIVELDLELDYSYLRFNCRGSSSGKHILKGICPNTSFTLNSSNNVLANELESENVEIGHNGLGDAYIWATDSLGVIFYSSGNVYYRGNPFITEKRVQINNQKATGQVLPN